VQLLDRLVDARDVAERDLRRVHGEPLGARLAEGHDLRSTALDLVHQEYPEPDEDQERQHVRQQREDHARSRRLDVEVGDLALGRCGAQLVDQDVGVVERVADLVAGLVGAAQRDLGGVVLRPQRHGLDLALVDLLEEPVEALGGRLVGARDQLGGEERQHDHDQDRERGALEEPAHRLSARFPHAGDGTAGQDEQGYQGSFHDLQGFGPSEDGLEQCGRGS
jgi:hypothetical protein